MRADVLCLSSQVSRVKDLPCNLLFCLQLVQGLGVKKYFRENFRIVAV